MTRGEAYVTHVTLNTGHTRRSPRSEVDDAVVTIVAQQLAEARADGRAEIRPGFELVPVTVGAALVATVTDSGGTPLVTIAIAAKSRVSARTWDALASAAGAEARAEGPPPVPWCAAWLHPAAAAVLKALMWLGDYERCLAWAWIERSPNEAPSGPP